MPVERHARRLSRAEEWMWGRGMKLARVKRVGKYFLLTSSQPHAPTAFAPGTPATGQRVRVRVLSGAGKEAPRIEAVSLPA